jgi:dienelactone hydrolase
VLSTAAREGKIAVDKVAVMGQSCGGFLSIALGADPRVKTIGVFNSGNAESDARRPAIGVSHFGRPA